MCVLDLCVSHGRACRRSKEPQCEETFPGFTQSVDSCSFLWHAGRCLIYRHSYPFCPCSGFSSGIKALLWTVEDIPSWTSGTSKSTWDLKTLSIQFAGWTHHRSFEVENSKTGQKKSWEPSSKLCWQLDFMYKMSSENVFSVSIIMEKWVERNDWEWLWEMTLFLTHSTIKWLPSIIILCLCFSYYNNAFFKCIFFMLKDTKKTASN